jgi:NTP pyrophosphatase (non-canonical NTP hydrolase)
VYGLVTEAGEMMDQVKRTKLYGKKVDTINLVEEAGDIMWYLAILCDDLNIDFEELWEKNINKLKVRFPDKFNYQEAIDRKLSDERKAIE